MGSYHLSDVDAKVREILDILPNAKIFRRDYGFELVADRGGRRFIVMQRPRGTNDQFINRPASEAIAFLRGEAT